MVEVAGPTDGCPSGGSNQKQPKTGPRALALNGLALWTGANSWRGPRPPRPAYTMCEHWDTSAVDTTDATLFGSNAYYPRELQHYWRSNPADDQDWLFIQICNRRAQRFSIITSPTEQWRCEIRQNRPFVNRSDNNTCLDGIIYKKYSSEIKYEQKAPCLDSIDWTWWECYRQWRLIFVTILFAWNRLDGRL